MSAESQTLADNSPLAGKIKSDIRTTREKPSTDARAVRGIASHCGGHQDRHEGGSRWACRCSEKVFQRKDSGLSQDLIAKARALGVATLSASMGEPVGRDQIIVRGGVTRVVGSGVSAGPAVTVWNPGGDDTMLRYAIEACRPGDILVVTTPVDGFAQWGDNASTWARGLNIAAVTVDGSVRDVA
ncbi:MAG: RraA family protein, partial [Betaproteobacteria bacterium]|nr:RraA family protein [Betaproteobacteria bacterium]